VSPTVALLADGRVVVAGGITPGPQTTISVAVRSIEVYDPKTGAFERIGSLPIPATVVRAVIALPNGQVAVATEDDLQDGTTLHEQLFLWDSAEGTFEEVKGATLPRYPSYQLLRDGRVLAIGDVGGSDGTTLFGVGIVWDPEAGTFQQTPAAPWRQYSTIELNDGRLLMVGNPNVVGGSGGNAVATLDLTTGASVLIPGQRACYPGIARLLDGRVAFIGGLQDCQTHDVDTGGHEAPAVPWVQYFQ
jgi:hypothetical protein